MKVGIISIHSAHNYGSVLQAYALQEELKKFSNSVKIINYRPYYLEKRYKLFSIGIYKEYKGFFNKIIHLGWRVLKFKDRYQKYTKFKNYINNRYNLTKKYKRYEELKDEADNYDVVFCGSDQIWNTDITNGFDKTFYLGFAGKNTIKASYAASVGRNKIDDKYESEYYEYIKQFDFISLREKSSKNLIEKYTDKEVYINIDPTLLIKKEEWDILSKNSKINIPYKYIFVYILEENEEFIKIVNALSNYLGMKVVSISKKKRFNNEIIIQNAGPEDFLKLFKDAEFVVTNSFHGTVFSLIYEKRNCIVPHKKTGNRMCDLMETIGLKERIAKDCESLNLKEITKIIDYDAVKEKLEKEKQIAEDYIRSVLK